jgi:hypothetical protein
MLPHTEQAWPLTKLQCAGDFHRLWRFASFGILRGNIMTATSIAR